MSESNSNQLKEIELRLTQQVFLAMFKTSTMVKQLSLGLLMICAISAIGLAFFQEPMEGISGFILGSLLVSGISGLLGFYAALRLAIDIEIFESLKYYEPMVKSREQLETLLFQAVNQLKQGAPGITSSNQKPLDPIYIYRRAAQFYYWQIGYLIIQILAFIAFLILLFYGKG